MARVNKNEYGELNEFTPRSASSCLGFKSFYSYFQKEQLLFI